MVPSWVYKKLAIGEMSIDEVEQLEKLASDLRKEANIASTLFGGAVGSGIGALAGGEENRGRGALAGGIAGGIGGNLIGRGAQKAVELADTMDGNFLRSLDIKDYDRVSPDKLREYFPTTNNTKARKILLGPEEGGLVGDPTLNRRYADFTKNYFTPGGAATDEDKALAMATLGQLGGGAGLATLGAAGAGRLARKKEEQEKTASASLIGRAGARAAVADKSNNLHKVLKSVPQEDRDDVLRALRSMRKEANYLNKAKGALGDYFSLLSGRKLKDVTESMKETIDSDTAALADDLEQVERTQKLHQRYANNIDRLRNRLDNLDSENLSQNDIEVMQDYVNDQLTMFEKATRGNQYMMGKANDRVVNTKNRLARAKEDIDRVRSAQTKARVGTGIAGGLGLGGLYMGLKNRQEQEKEAAQPLSIGQAGMLMGGAALAPVVGQLAGRGIDKLLEKSPAQRQQDLKRILEVHPDLGRPEDPRVQMAYASLTKLNPEYAEDPLIAGPLLKQIVESRMDPTNPMSASYVDPGIAKGLSEARKSIREGNPRNTFGDSFGSSLSSGVQAATLGGIVAPGLPKDTQSPGGFLY